MAIDYNQDLEQKNLETITLGEAKELLQTDIGRRQNLMIGLTVVGGAAAFMSLFLPVPINLLYTCVPTGAGMVVVADSALYLRNDTDRKEFEADPAGYCRSHYNKELID